MKKETITELLIKFYSDTCTSDEYEKVMYWLSDPLNKEEADKIMSNHWKMLGATSDERELDSEKVFDKIKKQITDDNFEDGKKISGFGYFFFLKAAALFLFFLTASLIAYKYYKDVGFTEKYVTYVTERGIKDTVLLVDGSKVILNNQSILRVSEDYITNRKLVLQGEAFFDVVKNPENPFTVSASGMIVTALGTSFNIKIDENISKVNLVSGVVKVEKERSKASIYLDPGDKAYLDKKEDQLYKGQTNESIDLAWLKNIIVFDHSSAKEMVDILEANFDVDVKVYNKDQHEWSYSGKFKDQELLEILDLISFSMGFKYEVKDDVVKIY